MSYEAENGIDPVEQELDPNFVPPNDGSWVPRKVMNERVGSAVTKVEQQLAVEREARIRLEEKVKSLATSQQSVQTKEEPTYTMAQLREYVEEGKISQVQADGIYEAQNDKRIKSEIDKAMKTHQQSTSVLSTVENGLSTYLDLIPDLLTEGSKNRTKVAAEYNKLIPVFGAPVPDSLEDKRLQLVALQNAFGDASTLKQQRLARSNTAGERETHQEYAGQGDEPGASEDNKVLKGLSKHKQDYYRKMIDKGFYKSWKEVGEELKYASR